ncbi:hypothetical protein C5K17_30330, partial [Shigella dysenteriae]|uniref:IS3 family transposase n=1 Tax=Shigella dysenteriae TaxID=622 RepID=UPI000D42FEB2
RDEAISVIREYIEIFYNRQRRHSRLGNISPAAFREKYHQMAVLKKRTNGSVRYCQYTSSIGYAMTIEHASAEKLQELADHNMYQAKHQRAEKLVR